VRRADRPCLSVNVTVGELLKGVVPERPPRRPVVVTGGRWSASRSFRAQRHYLGQAQGRPARQHLLGRGAQVARTTKRFHAVHGSAAKVWTLV